MTVDVLPGTQEMEQTIGQRHANGGRGFTERQARLFLSIANFDWRENRVSYWCEPDFQGYNKWMRNMSQAALLEDIREGSVVTAIKVHDREGRVPDLVMQMELPEMLRHPSGREAQRSEGCLT